MSKLETIAGRIVHVGSFTFDAHCHTYSAVEVETASGRIDMTTVMAANELDRVIEPGREVAMTVLRSGTGAKAKTVILGVCDTSQRRTFVNEEMFTLRAHATKQAVLYSLMSVVLLPVEFLLFVLPGFIWLWVLWRSWTSIGQFPTLEEIRESVAALDSKTPAMASA
jgi:hypothetical protein